MVAVVSKLPRSVFKFSLLRNMKCNSTYQNFEKLEINVKNQSHEINGMLQEVSARNKTPILSYLKKAMRADEHHAFL